MSPAPRPFRIIPCSEWRAKPAKGAIVAAGKPSQAIFHHTAGHVPNFEPGETYAESCAYARGIQNFHMNDRDWNDSGHNFLVTRGGYILEGRHGSVAAVMRGGMVVSAHCPKHNSQPGVEIEHNGAEPMTPIQREAAIWLFAWLCREGSFAATQIFPHRQFFPTDCPGVLANDLPNFRHDVQAALEPDAPAHAVYDVRVFNNAGVRIKRWARTTEPGVMLTEWNISEHKPARITIDRVDL